MTASRIAQPGGLLLQGETMLGAALGAYDAMQFDLKSVTAGAAVTTVQQKIAVPFLHRVRGFWCSATAATTIVAGTDPAVDVYRHAYHPGPVTAALASPAVAGNVDDGVHHYAVTFVTAAGESEPSSTVSVTVAAHGTNGKVQLSAIPLGPTGATGPACTARKIYRTAAADATALLLLATISDNTTTTYLDNTADSGLGAAAPTANTAAATILSGTIKLSDARRNFVDQVLLGTLATGEATPTLVQPCLYSIRCATGASTGAITNLKGGLIVEPFSTLGSSVLGT